MERNMKIVCPNCREFIENGKTYCLNCKCIICDNCNKSLSIDDLFCGNCGKNVKDLIYNNIDEMKKIEEKEKEEIERKKLENEMGEYASGLIIDCEGNKFKAIKEFKEKYSVDNDVAAKYVNMAYEKINNKNSNIEEINSDEKPTIEEIIKRNNYDKLLAINEVKKIYGYDLSTSKSCVDDALDEMKENSGYIDPRGIKKTIIVSQSSRKKATSAIGRGLIGNAILGPVGLLAGGMSAKSKEKTTFQVIYNSGKQKTITVSNGSFAFKEYCKYLDN